MCNPPIDQHGRMTLGESHRLLDSHSISTISDDNAASIISSSSNLSSKHDRDHHPNDNSQPCPTKASSDTTAISKMLDALPPTQQIIVLSFFMFLFFGMHNILQEALVNLLQQTNLSQDYQAAPTTPEGVSISKLKSNRTIIIAYAETIGVLAFSYLERVLTTRESGFSRVAPLQAYPLLAGCLFASSSMSNLSLSYINFPTKVGKLIH